jgi:hypothetical protein
MLGNLIHIIYFARLGVILDPLRKNPYALCFRNFRHIAMQGKLEQKVMVADI